MVKIRERTTQNLEKKAGARVSMRWFRAMSLPAKICLFVLLAVVLFSVLAPLIAPFNPYDIFWARTAPNGQFLFGTDDKGRDVLSRMMYGGQYSLVIGLGATGFALVLGSILGSIAAVSRKWISEVIMRIMDVFMSFPGIALAAIIVLTMSPSLFSITIAIGILYVPQICRIVRANVVSEYNQDYARAAVVSGARAPHILFVHVVRNCLAPILVYTIVLVADAIVFEASLSFISAGIPEPTPTWGNILADARNGVLGGRWWQALFPGLTIMVTVLSFNILAEGMTDAMAAPKDSIAKAVERDENSEENILLTNPVEAYKQQKEGLEDKLARLAKAEAQRDDRKGYDMDAEVVLSVDNLCIQFPRHGDVNVVDDVTFQVRAGQTVGLVGESGCGKSITSFSVMGLLDKKAKISGNITFEAGRINLLDLSPKEMEKLRGTEIAMIYQDALSSLNPSMLIRKQLNQLIKRGGTRSAEELMELVGLDPKRTLDSYPHELSGGQRQRVLIAMALTRDPKLIIADEPTTALDVTVQKQVIKLLNDLQKKLGFAMIFVSHDLALVADVAGVINVMYAGQLVEVGTTKEILTNPIHEYTRGLLGSVLSIEAGGDKLHQVPGSVPSPADFPKGDRFAPRSSHPDVKSDVRPILKTVGYGYHYYAELPDAEMERLGLIPYKKRSKNG